MASIAVLGLGRIGLRLAWELKSLGHEVIGVDASSHAADRAERLLGIRVEVADATAPDGLRVALRGVDLAAVALPGGVGHRALLGLVRLGVDAVDVSFSPVDPYEAVDPLARRVGATVVVDAGVAPGLSNMLAGMLVRAVNARGARILVGGVSEDPSVPLGLSAAWNTEDLLEEYLRKARLVRNGRLEAVDPLEHVALVNVPGVGLMEAIPTDGLRTMLRNLSGLEELAEYTLRWPGHSRVIRELKMIGLLDDAPAIVEGASVSPRKLLAKLLASRLPSRGDIVILIAEAWGEGWAGLKAVARHTGPWSAMSIATAAFQAAVTDLLAHGRVEGPGVVAPEQLAQDEKAAGRILQHLAARGVKVEKLTEPPKFTRQQWQTQTRR
ncbi:saccharopine dehydrogenase family protein [Stetteria hydrogenophila]